MPYPKGKYKHPPQPCAYCGEIFQPARSGRRFCSISCGRKSKAAVDVELTCKECLQPYYIRKSFIHPNRGYCSRDCYKVARRKQGEIDRAGHKRPIDTSAHDTLMARVLRSRWGLTPEGEPVIF